MQARCPTPEARRSWVAAITHNEGRRHWGRARRELATELDGEPDATDYADDADRRLDLARALEQLPPPDRTLLTLRYDLDQTQAAIATALGLPEGTVKVRLHRARGRLAEILEHSEH
jgi:RNA polymerase sigma-70 factor, ECF subfamily